MTQAPGIVTAQRLRWYVLTNTPNSGSFAATTRKNYHLKGYEYSQEGIYFVTVCTKDRECLLGDIASNEIMKCG